MKKKNFKSLLLNKNSISNLQYHQLQGGARATDDITNCNLCAAPNPKTNDGCDTFATHTSRNDTNGVPSNCDVSY